MNGLRRYLIEGRFSFSAILPSSTGEAACIFRMTRPRCTATVISLIPSVEATFFVSMPDNKSHHLALTCGQCAVSFLQGRNVAALPAGRFSTREGLLDCIYEILTSNRLRQKLHGTRFHGLHRQRDIGMCGYENDRNPGACLSQFSLYIKPAHAGKSDVQN